ncbi:Serpentine receptor class gamma [Meloidogyne graminicola]|uniref:Serpentine receptor class gamma n=1 Tax=Meloidogyne graminicola TaxID=189291 RepID=A0A8S9ZEL2_9BILA|nr:Serpentine receptor class gamma [Meloidogyne graminicola]
MNLSTTIQNNNTIVVSPFVYSLLQTFSFNVAIPHIISAVIGLPSALLYIFEIIIIIKNWKEYKSSFFVLFLLRAIICLINLFFAYLNQRFLRIGWFIYIYQQIPAFLLSIFYFFIYYPFHVEELASIFMIINRFIAVAFPLDYEYIWTKKKIVASVLFCCITPLIFTYQILQYTTYITRLMNGNIYGLAYSQKTFGYSLGLVNYYRLFGMFSSNNGIAAISSFFFMAVSLILNIFTLIIFKRKNNILNIQNNLFTSNKILMERKLTVYVLITFLGQLLLSLYMVAWYMGSSIAKPYFDIDTYNLIKFCNTNKSSWVNDISTIALPSLFMLWANSRLRQMIFRIIFNKKVSDSSKLNKNQNKLFIQRSIMTTINKN